MTTINRRILDPAMPASVAISTMPDGQRLYYTRTGDTYLARRDAMEAAESAVRHNQIYGHSEYPTDHRRRA